MVKAQKIIRRKALTFGVILSIGFFGVIAKAGPKQSTGLSDYGGDELVAARQRGVTNVADNTAAVARAEEIKKQLEADPGNAAAARELQQTNRGIDQRSQQTYGDADRFQGDREMQQLATNVAITAKDWPHVQAYADRWAALAKPDSPEWAKAVNTGGLAAHEAGDHKKAVASALRVLEKFPKDKDALFVYNASKGRVPAVAAPPPGPAMDQSRPAPPPAAPSPYRDPQVQLAGERAFGRQQAIDFYKRAKSSNNLNDAGRALEYAQAAIKADPSLPDGYMERARALLGTRVGDRRDQLAQAINDLRYAMELWMKNGQTGRLAEANGLSAKAKNATGDYKGAHDDADKAMSYDAGYAPAYWERGAAREALKQKELALADYNKSAALLPDVYGAANDAATARLMAPENAGPAPVARPAVSPLRKAWTRLLEKAGGGAYLFGGAMGAVFVLLAGYVFFFAKEDSAAGRFKTRWFTPSGGAETAGRNGHDDVIGKTVGGHILIQSVRDRGGMGLVFNGLDTKLERSVAVKRLLPELQGDKASCARMLDEARTLAKFHHPNIVEIFEVIDDSDGIFIICPLIDGRTVHAEFDDSDGRRLAPARILEILVPVGDAITYAHGKHVIHRDIKPSNIMTTAGGRVMVMDFGIARSNVPHSHITAVNTIVGTPAYMAPEQATGNVCRQSDVFALGVTVYQLATGRLPFGMNDLLLKLERRSERFPAPSSLVPSLPTEFDAAIEKALDADPLKRQKSCSELAQEVAAAFQQKTPPLA